MFDCIAVPSVLPGALNEDQEGLPRMHDRYSNRIGLEASCRLTAAGCFPLFLFGAKAGLDNRPTPRLRSYQARSSPVAQLVAEAGIVP
jgi:hypothetical protein